MKYIFAIAALLVASTEGTKINREVYQTSYEEPSQFYSTTEQMDQQIEVQRAQEQAVTNAIQREEDAKKRLVELENKKKQMQLDEQHKKEAMARAEQAKQEAELAKHKGKSALKFEIETTSFD